MNKLSILLRLFRSRITNTDPNNKLRKIFTLLSLIGFLLVIFLIAAILLKRYEKEVRENTGVAVQSVLESTHQAIKHIWIERYFDYTTSIWASDPLVIRNTEKIIGLQHDRKSLLKSPAQKEIRNFFINKLVQHDALGIFIISPDNINLVSMRDNNVGDENLIGLAYKDRLTSVFRGKEQVIPPIYSDVPLPDESGELIDGYPTMFIVAPIKDNDGNIIAALSIRLNPFQDFSLIAQTGRFGNSGETYFIDNSGNLIAESRFTENLSRIGLLDTVEYSLLNIEIRDPGGNLKKGYKPELSRKDQPFTLAAEHVIDRESGYSITAYRDYRGVPVLGAWLWDDELGIGFITEIDEEEALQPYKNTLTITFGLLGVTLLLTTVFLISFQKIRQRSNRSIQKSMQRFKVLFESSSDANLIFNETGIINCNNVAVQMLGCKDKQDLLARLPSVFSPEYQPDDRLSSEKSAEMDRIAYENGHNRFDWIHKRVDTGESFPVEVSLTPVEFNERKALLTVWHDLSKRKKAEDKIRESEEKVRLLLESISEGILGVDPNGNTSFINPSALKMLGFEQEEIIGKSVHKLIYHSHADGSSYPPEDCPMFKAYTDGTSHHVDNEVLWRKDKTWFHVEYTATPMKKGGRLAGAVFTFIDTTERKRAQEELRQNLEDLERFSKLAIGREKQMIKLKKEINELLRGLGQPDKYKIVD